MGGRDLPFVLRSKEVGESGCGACTPRQTQRRISLSGRPARHHGNAPLGGGGGLLLLYAYSPG